jgi:hypothetical protein
MLTFRKEYFLFTVVLLLVEIFIAVFVHDSFIRPYFGDFLVVILIYCFLRSFLRISIQKAAIFTLLFSFLVEALQILKLYEYIKVENAGIAGTITGTSFSFIDLLMYTLGILFVWLVERTLQKRRLAKNNIIIQP